MSCFVIERKELSNLYLGFTSNAKLSTAIGISYAYKFYNKESAEAFLDYLQSVFCCKFSDYIVTEYIEDIEKVIKIKRGYMFQGGEKPLHGICDQFDSDYLHYR